MFLTVTPNAGLDRILFIDRFEPQTTMRTRKMLDAVGGKGHDISVAVRCLGQETVAVSFKAGVVGETLAGLLSAHGIQADLVDIPGETRLAHVIIEEALHQHSHITTRGYTVIEANHRSLLERLRVHLPRASWLAAGGSLPEGLPESFYGEVTALAHEHGVPVLVDASGPPALGALSSRPDILKMNLQEFRATFNTVASSLESAATSCHQLLGTHSLPCLVVTNGSQGILAATSSNVSLTWGPAQQEVNAAGAGDAASAALLWRLGLGDDQLAALRWAAAAGSAAVLTEETAVFDLQVAWDILPRIEQTILWEPTK